MVGVKRTTVEKPDSVDKSHDKEGLSDTVEVRSWKTSKME